MRASTLPSEHLDTVVRQLSPFCGGVEVSMTGRDFDNLVERLSAIRKMMNAIEREVGALRLAEAAREGRKIVDQLATDQLHSMVTDPEGKVIRPDFGGRK